MAALGAGGQVTSTVTSEHFGSVRSHGKHSDRTPSTSRAGLHTRASRRARVLTEALQCLKTGKNLQVHRHESGSSAYTVQHHRAAARVGV